MASAFSGAIKNGNIPSAISPAVRSPAGANEAV